MTSNEKTQEVSDEEYFSAAESEEQLKSAGRKFLIDQKPLPKVKNAKKQ